MTNYQQLIFRLIKKKIKSLLIIFFLVISITGSHAQGGCAGINIWSANETYTGNDEVQLNSNHYKANWWTQSNPESNNGPTGSGSPWTLLGPCGTNIAPIVSITSPSEGTSIVQAGNLLLAASASDSDGSINQVEFFIDGTSIGIDNSSPYSLDWNASAIGSHDVTAIAEDNDGATTVSVVVAIVVTAGPNPVVSITAPSNNANFSIGSSITIAANATDTDGTVSLVEFFQGNVKLGQDDTAPYSYTWNNVIEGNYVLTSVVTDNDNNQTTSVPVQVAVFDSNVELPERIILGYWHNFDNGSGFIRPEDVSTKFDIVHISFAEPVAGSASLMAFAPDPAISDVDFRAGVQALQNRGQEVVISIGGANGTVQLNTIAERDEFVNSMISIIENYGFDGMDIDFEGQSLSLDFGDNDFANPTTPRIVNLIDAINTVHDHFGNDFILTMAPETFFVQLGYSFYGGISAGADRRAGAYLPVIHALRDKLDLLQVQYYNSGSITALDNQAYAMGNADFYVSLIDMLLKGFPITGDASKFFPPLRQDQILIGLPANVNAGGGFAPVTEVHKALDYLIKGIPFGGGYTLSQNYPDLRGLMTWSINWDAFNNFEFSNQHRAYFDALDGVNPPPVTSITSPISNSNVAAGTSVSISANASDSNGSVAQVEFFVDGSSLGADASSPYSIVWNGATVGIHVLTAIATDNEGATGTSNIVQINVSENLELTTIVVSPINETISTGSSQQFSAQGFDQNNNPFSTNFSWTATGGLIDANGLFTGAAVGSFIVTANAGVISGTAQISVSAIVNASPVTTITSPSSGSTFDEGTSISISANASDADGTISQVEFISNGVVIHVDSSSPYVFGWSGAPVGTYTLTVRATDDQGATAISSSVSVEVEAVITGGCSGIPVWSSSATYNGGNEIQLNGTKYRANWWTQAHPETNNGVTGSGQPWLITGTCGGPQNPVVNITSPTNFGNFTLGSSINIGAIATDDGSISQVEFFADGTSIGIITSSPYSVSWNSAALGTHSLTAIATDNEGNQTTSSAVSITVLTQNNPNEAFRVVGYFPTWAGDVSTIQYSKLTHLNYSFILPTSTGGISALSNPSRLNQLVANAHANGVKVCIAVGGWNGGNDSAFEILAANTGTRTTFVNNLMAFVNAYNLDGIDMDWEYPDPGTSGTNFTLLMTELATALHAQNKILTAAVLAQGNTGEGVQSAVFSQIDFLNIMAYDGPTPHSSFAYGTSSLNYWLGRGLPKEKAVLGVPFYGRTPYMSYNALVASDAGAPFKDNVGNVYYNGIATMQAKTTYALENASGIMIWELTQDATGSNSLLTAIDDRINSSSARVNINSEKALKVEDQMVVFPNPVNGGDIKFTLKIDPQIDKARVQLISLVGQIVYDNMIELVDGQISGEIDSRNLISGLYALRISTANSWLTKNVIVK